MRQSDWEKPVKFSRQKATSYLWAMLWSLKHFIVLQFKRPLWCSSTALTQLGFIFSTKYCNQFKHTTEQSSGTGMEANQGVIAIKLSYQGEMGEEDGEKQTTND